jgi:hydrogenase maturation protease
MTRTLIAGFGNELRGDDGFGVVVVRRLQERALGCHVRLLEVGTGGLHLAQELMAGYDRVIIVDAMMRGGAPGDLYVIQVESVEEAASIDLHLAIPARALSVAKALGALPAETILVGCEPAEVEELRLGLTQPVERSVQIAMDRIDELIRGNGRPQRPEERA